MEADSREKERQKAREQQESNNRQHAEVKRPEAEQFQKQTQRRPEFGDPKREQEEGFKAENEKIEQSRTQAELFGRPPATEEGGHSFKDENDERISQITEEIRLGPDNAEAYFWRARAYHEKQR